MSQQELHRSVGRKHKLPRQEPIHHTTSRVDIRADVHFDAAQCLLRCNERRSLETLERTELARQWNRA
jgi:hypothetical protein